MKIDITKIARVKGTKQDKSTKKGESMQFDCQFGGVKKKT